MGAPLVAKRCIKRVFMYIPSAFRIEDAQTLKAFMQRYAFATLVTADAEPFITQLPLLLDADRGPHGTLLGHFAKPNAHWQMDHARLTSVAVFHGPHAYVSPTWYRSGSPAVPTWNYATVQARGKLKLIPEPERIAAILERLVAVYEGPRAAPWKNQLPEAVRDKMVRSVMGFEMAIEMIEGKFKFSQNRVREDYTGAIEGLESAGDAESIATAEFARMHLGLPKS